MEDYLATNEQIDGMTSAKSLVGDNWLGEGLDFVNPLQDIALGWQLANGPPHMPEPPEVPETK